MKMDFDEYDRIDDFELNEILWRAIKGKDAPVPPAVRRAIAFRATRPAGHGLEGLTASKRRLQCPSSCMSRCGPDDRCYAGSTGASSETPTRQRDTALWFASIRSPSKALAKASSPEPDGERSTPAMALKPDLAAFARRFLDLAREQPADRASFDALSWVVSHCPHGVEGDQALQLLATSHLDDPRLSPVLQRLGSSKSSEAEKLLRAALEKSTDREVQAHACYTLA